MQGEGSYVGRRSLFIRFQYCNLTCTWCDTKYTWLKRSGVHQWCSATSLKEQIKKSKVKHVILTGGEPTLFDLAKLFLKDVQFHVESNGSIIPTEPMSTQLRDKTQLSRDAMEEKVIRHFNWVISPKLSNADQFINKRAIKYWANWAKEKSNEFLCTFKFIVRHSEDIDEVEYFIEQFQISPHIVFLTIEGTTKESQLQTQLVDEILERGFHYSPRLQVLLWNRKRKK